MNDTKAELCSFVNTMQMYLYLQITYLQKSHILYNRSLKNTNKGAYFSSAPSNFIVVPL